MTITVTSPITGANMTGFTSPTYTVTDDQAPSLNGKQKAVTALGGTQAGVNVHSVSNPFTSCTFRPVQFKTLPEKNAATGIVKNIPVNRWSDITRKGLVCVSGQNPQVGTIKVFVDIPAGADINDPANVKAMFSLAIGKLNQIALSFADSTINGTF